MNHDSYDLQRFVAAQDFAGTYDQATAELRRGRKTGHWIWFVFPQIAGLGHSPTSQMYAISSLAEAQAYLQHPVLGPRLKESARILGRLRQRERRADTRRPRCAETAVVHDLVLPGRSR